MSTPTLTVEELRARHMAEQAEKRRLREEEDARVEREFTEGLKRAEEEEEARREQEEASKRIAERQRLLDLLEKEPAENTKKGGKRKRVEEPAIAGSSVRNGFLYFFLF